MAAAVGVVLVFLLLFRFPVKGKGSPAGRLAALLAVIIVLWLFVSVHDPAAGMDVARAGSSGTGTAISGISRFIGDVFGH
jgi:hypothetical protein